MFQLQEAVEPGPHQPQQFLFFCTTSSTTNLVALQLSLLLITYSNLAPPPSPLQGGLERALIHLARIFPQSPQTRAHNRQWPVEMWGKLTIRMKYRPKLCASFGFV